MTLRTVWLLAICALLVGASRGWRLAENRSPVAAPADPVANAALPSPRFGATVPAAAVTWPDAPAPALPVALTPDAAALVAEQVLLQQMAGADELGLSPEQWARFAEVSSHHQAIRHAYEATLARAAATPAGSVRLEIPPYPEAGDALRLRLHADLADKLGPAVAQGIAARLGPALEGHFGGFGMSAQTLEFFREPRAGDAEYQVTRTVTYARAAAALPDGLVTRREVHFPGLEDPSGHHWGPFLSVLAARRG